MRISSIGEAAIEGLIAERQSEELFVDFKRSSDNGTGARLSDADRGNFAKAISGFGNSEGIVVWGVDCRPNQALRDGEPQTKLLKYVFSYEEPSSHAGVRNRSHYTRSAISAMSRPVAGNHTQMPPPVGSDDLPQLHRLPGLKFQALCRGCRARRLVLYGVRYRRRSSIWNRPPRDHS